MMQCLDSLKSLYWYLNSKFSKCCMFIQVCWYKPLWKIVSDVLRFKLTLWFYAFNLVRKFIFIDLVRLLFIRKAPRQKEKKRKKKRKEKTRRRKQRNKRLHNLRSCKSIPMQIGGLTSEHLFVIFYLTF